MSEPKRPDHWIVRMNHRNRTAGFLVAGLCTALHLGAYQHASAVWIALFLQFFVYPQLLWLRARRATDQRRAEFVNSGIDSLCFGFWAGFLGFPSWIAFAFFIGAVINPLIFRGRAGLIPGHAAFLGPALLGWGLSGFALSPLPTPLVSALAALAVMTFLYSVAFGIFERTTLLHRTKQELRGKESLLKQQLAEITLLQQQLQEQAIRDPLTGLFNRRQLEVLLERAILGHERKQHQLSVILIDIDHFKQINDQYGHPAGDAVLRAIAARMTGKVRASDAIARMGGEEFIVLLQDGEAQYAADLAERIRADWAAMEVRVEELRIRSTLSAGVATLRPGETAAQLVRRADVALYAAKRGGRNRVVVAD